MTTGILFASIWIGSSLVIAALHHAIAAGLRRRHNVTDLSERREQRELDGAMTRHPAGHCKVRGGRVVIR